MALRIAPACEVRRKARRGLCTLCEDCAKPRSRLVTRRFAPARAFAGRPQVTLPPSLGLAAAIVACGGGSDGDAASADKLTIVGSGS
jgi:hypothetical protein